METSAEHEQDRVALYDAIGDVTHLPSGMPELRVGELSAFVHWAMAYHSADPVTDRTGTPYPAPWTADDLRKAADFLDRLADAWGNEVGK